MTVNSKVKRRRDPLSPKPILDKRLLLSALEARAIFPTDLQLATFYQLLHRQNYPELKEFVRQYYDNESSSISSSSGSSSSSSKTNETNETNLKQNETTMLPPSRNPISKKRKNLAGRQLPKAFLDFLADENNDFVTVTSKIQSKPTSSDGTTTKMAIELQDKHVVESVLMRHVSEHGSRATVCVSSQVGCAMGCTFCATGTMGIRGDLCSGEILEQLVHAGRILAADSLLDKKKRNKNNIIVAADGSEKKKSETSLDFVRNVVFMGEYQYQYQYQYQYVWI